MNSTENTATIKSHGRRLQAALIAFLVMTPVGVIIMLSSSLREDYLWTTTIYLAVQFTVTVFLLEYFLDYKSIIYLTLIVWAAAFLSELAGVKTGIPFGSYEYTDVLKPLAAGVPLAICAAWFIISVNSFILASIYSEDFRVSNFIYTALLVTAFDIALEPFASAINGFWIWKGEGNTPPVLNYAGWFITALIMSIFISIVIKKSGTRKLIVIKDKSIELPARIRLKIRRIPLIIIAVNILMFSAVNIYYGAGREFWYIQNSVISVLLIILTLMAIIKFRK